MLNQDFSDILSEFIAANVEFILVGAYALAAHGLIRATGDIDIWIRCDDDNARLVLSALAAFGAPMDRICLDDFRTSGSVFQIGVSPRRIDVITEIDGVEFEDAWPRRGRYRVAGLEVPVLSRDDLLRNKRATGRPKDLLDADWLESHPTAYGGGCG